MQGSSLPPPPASAAAGGDEVDGPEGKRPISRLVVLQPATSTQSTPSGLQKLPSSLERQLKVPAEPLAGGAVLQFALSRAIWQSPPVHQRGQRRQQHPLAVHALRRPGVLARPGGSDGQPMQRPSASRPGCRRRERLLPPPLPQSMRRHRLRQHPLAPLPPLRCPALRCSTAASSSTWTVRRKKGKEEEEEKKRRKGSPPPPSGLRDGPIGLPHFFCTSSLSSRNTHRVQY